MGQNRVKEATEVYVKFGKANRSGQDADTIESMLNSLKETKDAAKQSQKPKAKISMSTDEPGDYAQLMTAEVHKDGITKNPTKQKAVTMKDLFMHGDNMKSITYKTCIVWFSGSTVYYGILNAAGSLDMSTYWVITIYAVVEVISRLIGIKLMEHKKIGRKGLTVGGLICSGLCCLVASLL